MGGSLGALGDLPPGWRAGGDLRPSHDVSTATCGSSPARSALKRPSTGPRIWRSTWPMTQRLNLLRTGAIRPATQKAATRAIVSLDAVEVKRRLTCKCQSKTKGAGIKIPDQADAGKCVLERPDRLVASRYEANIKTVHCVV